VLEPGKYEMKQPWFGKVRANPELLRLRELTALGEMAKTGARFVVGLPIDGNSVLLKNDEKS
jgi:hypothetical protein